MKKVHLSIIYDDTWSTDEMCYEKNIGLFLKRIFKNNIDIDNNAIKNLFDINSNKIRFLILDNKYKVLTLNSKVPKELYLIAININDFMKQSSIILDEEIYETINYMYTIEELTNEITVDKKDIPNKKALNEIIIKKIVKPIIIKKEVSKKIKKDKVKKKVLKKEKKEKKKLVIKENNIKKTKKKEAVIKKEKPIKKEVKKVVKSTKKKKKR